MGYDDHMNMTFIYQLFLLLIITVLLPWLTIRNSVAMKALLLEQPAMRWAFYQQGALFQWLMVLLIMVSLWWSGAGPSAIGWSSYAHLGFWCSLLALVLLSWLTVRRHRPRPGLSHWVRRLYGHVAHFLPTDQRSYRWGVVMALTAGVCEELIYRGFLHHQLSMWLPVWAAVLLTNVVFALTHYTTGLINMLGSFVLGVLFSVGYLLTGDLWLSMWLHVLIDLLAMTLYPLVNQQRIIEQAS